MLTSKLFSNLRRRSKGLSTKINKIDKDRKDAVMTIMGVVLAVIWLILLTTALVLTCVVVIGAEFFIFALVSKGICLLLGSPWIGWGMTFLLYLIFIIIGSIYNAIKRRLD